MRGEVVAGAIERCGHGELVGGVAGEGDYLVRQGSSNNFPSTPGGVFKDGADARKLRARGLQHKVGDLVVDEVKLHLIDVWVKDYSLLLILSWLLQEIAQVLPFY